MPCTCNRKNDGRTDTGQGELLNRYISLRNTVPGFQDIEVERCLQKKSKLECIKGILSISH